MSPQQAIQLEELAARGNRVVAALHSDSADRRPLSREITGRWKLAGVRDLVELRFAKGILVIAPDALAFSNGVLAFAPNTRLITKALGTSKLVVFDESHLGLSESGTIVGLARRYRLEGLALGLAVFVALFLWRSMSPFPPLATSQEPRLIAGRTSSSGLTTLLARNVPPQDLAPTAWTLWTKGNPAHVPLARRERAEKLVRNTADPLPTLARVQSALKDKPSR
jgi:hypothetical protein